MAADRDLERDERLRALLGRAVAEAPAAPEVAEVERVGGALAAAPIHRPGPGRRALAVGIAAAVLVAGGVAAALVRDPDEPAPQQVTSAPATPKVRYVAGGLPEGYALASWDDQPASTGLDGGGPLLTSRVPPPAVSLYRRATDGVEVRVVLDPFTTVGGGDGDGSGDGRLPADDLAWLRATYPGQDLPAVALAGTVALREDQPPLEVSGRPGTTYYLRGGTRVVTVSVLGARGVAADAVLDGFTRRTDGGIAPPAAPAGFRTVADLSAGSATDRFPPTTSLTYDGPGSDQLTVITQGLLPEREDLLLAAARGLGSVERWGAHDVLVRQEGSGLLASFVDERGVLVTVGGPTARVRPAVEGLQALTDEAWDRFVAEDSAALARLPGHRSVEVAAVTVEERWSGTAAERGDRQALCLVVPADDATACRPDPGNGRADPDELADGSLLVSTLVDGNWWVYGRGAVVPGAEDEAGTPATSPLRIATDAGGDALIVHLTEDGRAWVAARLPAKAREAVVGLDPDHPDQTIPRPST